MFTSKEFEDFATSIGFKLISSSPYCAQANGQAEASNKILVKIIKKKIRENPKRWHSVLVKLSSLIGWLIMDQLNVHLMNWFMDMRLCYPGKSVWDLGGYHRKIS